MKPLDLDALRRAIAATDERGAKVSRGWLTAALNEIEAGRAAQQKVAGL